MRGLGTTAGGTGRTDTGTGMAMGRDRDGDGEDTGPERPGPEQPGPERPGPEQPGPEQPGPEQPGPEQAGPAPTRETLQAAFTAVAVVVALALFVSACATGGTGARDEGPARADSAGSAVASFTPSASAVPDPVEAVRLVKADPAVSVDVKRDLKPCVSDDYPVDVSSGDLTGGPASDLVVNVLSCGDGVGVGSYVYREQGGRYENVFKAEEPPVYAEIDRGYLVVTKQVYEKNDQLSNPSSENVVSYLWTAGRFVKKFSTHTDYGTLGDGEESAAPGG